MKTIYTQATMDLFHVGHLALLRRCRKLAGGSGRVIVGLLTDEAIEAYKRKAPIIPFKDRKEVILGCKYVDAVMPSDIYDINIQIEDPWIDYIVVGSDWAKKDLATHYGLNAELKEALEEKLIFFPYSDRESSTSIKQRCSNF